MPRELVNANITHVSYVDKGANKKQFFFTKSAAKQEPTFEKEVKVFINKDEAEQQLVYGIVYEPDAEDAHGDFMTAPEIEKAAHGFLKDARNIDTQHDFNAGVGEVVESYIAPADFTLGEQEIKKGSWVLVTKANDEIWEKIKKGEITGYSMAGTAETIEKQKEKPSVQPTAQETGLFNLLKNFFMGTTAVQKGEVRDRYERNQQRRNLYAVWDGLDSEFYSSIWDNRTPDVADFERLEEATVEFLEIIREIKDSGDIQKALGEKPGTVKKEEEDVKQEDIKKAVEEVLQPFNERLEALEKEGGEEPSVQTDDISEQVKKAVEEAVSSLSERLENIEKTRNISRQLSDDEKKSEKEIKKSVWDGLI